MRLREVWLRRLLGASGATLVAPAAVLCAAALVAAGGGFGGLGSLRQVVAGPSLPATGGVAVSGSADRDAGPSAIDIVAAGVVAGGPIGPRAGAGPGDDRAPRRGGPGRLAPARPSPGGQRWPTPPDAGPGGGGGGGGSGSSGPPRRGPVREIGETAKQVTAALPNPVGATGSRAIDTVVDAVERTLPGVD